MEKLFDTFKLNAHPCIVSTVDIVRYADAYSSVAIQRLSLNLCILDKQNGCHIEMCPQDKCCEKWPLAFTQVPGKVMRIKALGITKGERCFMSFQTWYNWRQDKNWCISHDFFHVEFGKNFRCLRKNFYRFLGKLTYVRRVYLLIVIYSVWEQTSHLTKGRILSSC